MRYKTRESTQERGAGMKAQELVTAAPEILGQLDKFGGHTEKDPEKRAEIIERENSDPVIRAAKEQKIKALLDKWEQWGIIKLTNKNEGVAL